MSNSMRKGPVTVNVFLKDRYINHMVNLQYTFSHTSNEDVIVEFGRVGIFVFEANGSMVGVS